jgi:hypothetical protein
VPRFSMAVPYRQGYRPFVAARSNSGLRAAYLSLLYMGVAAWAAAEVLIETVLSPAPVPESGAPIA